MFFACLKNEVGGRDGTLKTGGKPESVQYQCGPHPFLVGISTRKAFSLGLKNTDMLTEKPRCLA